METILSIAKLKELQDVSFHKDDKTILPSIEGAENDYVKKLISAPMYVYLNRNKEDANKITPTIQFVADIINGGTYGIAGNENSFLGLNKVISLYAYANLFYKDASVSRIGVILNEGQFALHLSIAQINETVSRINKQAEQAMNDVIDYVKSIDTTSLDAEQKRVIAACIDNCDSANETLNEWGNF